MCPYIQAGVGAVSTQSWVNPYLAIEALNLMGRGEVRSPRRWMPCSRSDEARDLRQIGVVDGQGRPAAWSGQSCTHWFGHIVGEHFAVQGNMLVSEATVVAMAAAFRGSEPLDLAERLLLAMEAGQAAGGDKRGRQSASLKVFGTEDYALLDLRVDEHAHPVAELRRVYTIARLQLAAFRRGYAQERRTRG